MNRTIQTIAYAPENGFRGEADLHVPRQAAGAPCVLVIHGGGWRAMDRFRFNAVCAALTNAGFAAFNINYRLTGAAPWPACGDDCLRAARLLLAAGHPGMAGLDTRRIAILGASAGGHLALMTGLRLPPERVAGIVSIAGPTDLLRFWTVHGHVRFAHLFGSEPATDAMLEAASPVSWVTPDSPPLLCVHSVHDELVPPAQSDLIAAAYAANGRSCEIHRFAGAGKAHGIWQNEAAEPDLLAPLQGRIVDFLSTCLNRP